MFLYNVFFFFFFKGTSTFGVSEDTGPVAGAQTGVGAGMTFVSGVGALPLTDAGGGGDAEAPSFRRMAFQHLEQQSPVALLP